MIHKSVHAQQHVRSVCGALLLVSAGLLAPTSAASAAPDPDESDTPAPTAQEDVVGQFNLWGSVAHYGRTEGLVTAVGDVPRRH